MGGVGIAVLAFFIYLMSRMAAPQMELLYGALELADANQIVTRLQADKIPYELRNNGAEVWVPRDRKLDLRVKMAEQALPSGGGASVGYELFDRTDALGSTSFVQNVNLVRALEGELGRTIRTVGGVKSARVHLVLPRRDVFTREVQQPSASVVLKMQGARLSKQQVLSIQHLMAAAVPQLQLSRISIIDDKGTLLARGFENQNDMLAQTSEEMRLNYENRLARTVETLLERSVGPGRVRAEVSAEMDFDRVATTEEIFDPESRVVRSQVTVSEGEQTQDGQSNSVSVSQNLPDAGTSGGDTSASSKINREQETTNFEISKTTRNHVKELGVTKRLSVAVLIDGIYATDGAGTRAYQPRDEKEMEKLAALVRSSIGYDANRGDQVEVINMQFAGSEEAAPLPDTKIFGFESDFIEKVASNLGLSVVAILFLLLVLKPLVSRAVEQMSAPVGADGRRLLGDQGMGAPALAGPAVPTPAPGMLEEEMEDLDELIDIDKVEGRVKASSIRKIGEIVEKHPDEALSIIRTWMYQET